MSAWLAALHFAWPWMLSAWPLPWLVRALLPAVRPHGAAMRMPAAAHVEEMIQHTGVRARATGAWPWLPLLAWTLLCVAAARPQSLGPPSIPPATGRGMMLAVDLSGSMQEPDMTLGGSQVDRLTAAKAVLADFLDRRAGDRVGLIVFGDRAFVLAPLTADLQAVRDQLDVGVVGLAGQSTALGDAVALAVKRLRELPTHERVLVLLTDGVNTSGVIEPPKAAELARDAGVRIYTVAIGGGDQQTLFGITLPSMGEDDVDEATLQRIADVTGGRFYRARDTDALARIYGEIDRLEPVAAKGRAIRPRIEHAWQWLAAALAVLAAWMVGRFAGRRQ